MHFLTTTLLAGLAIGVSACDSRESPNRVQKCLDPRAGPRLVLRDSTTLQESDSLFLDRPAATFTLDDGGTVYIPDAGTNRLLSFSADGRPGRTLGSAGSGPGEFRGIGFPVLVTPDLAMQNDYQLERLHVYDRASARRAHLTYTARLTGLYLFEGRLWFGLPDFDAGLAVGSERMAAILGGRAETSKTISAAIIGLPSEYDMRRACLDAELTTPGSGLTRLTVHKDEVVVLDQVVHESQAGGRVRTVRRRYSIDSNACQWLPTTRGRS